MVFSFCKDVKNLCKFYLKANFGARGFLARRGFLKRKSLRGAFGKPKRKIARPKKGGL